MNSFQPSTIFLATLSAIVWLIILPRSASADSGKYHGSYDRTNEARKSAKKQYVSEKEQISLEEKQLIKEKEQSQLEFQQSQAEEYRSLVLRDIVKVNDSLEYARQIGDENLIFEREADLKENRKLLNEINMRLDLIQKSAQYKLSEAQDLKGKASEKYQAAQAELEIIKRLEYERLRADNAALADQLVNTNLLDAFTLIQKKRSSTVFLRDLSEANVDFYRNQGDLEKVHSWEMRQEQHIEELNLLDVQIDFYKSAFVLMTSILTTAIFLLSLYIKKKKISSQKLIDRIEQIAELILREDLFRDFQESSNLIHSTHSLLEMGQKMINLIGFLQAEFSIRKENKKNPNDLKGTGSGTISPEVEPLIKDPDE